LHRVFISQCGLPEHNGLSADLFSQEVQARPFLYLRAGLMLNSCIFYVEEGLKKKMAKFNENL